MLTSNTVPARPFDPHKRAATDAMKSLIGEVRNQLAGYEEYYHCFPNMDFRYINREEYEGTRQVARANGNNANFDLRPIAFTKDLEHNDYGILRLTSPAPNGSSQLTFHMEFGR